MSDQGIPPGWYPNPENQMEERYWAGYEWTQHVRPAGHGGSGSGLRSAGDTIGTTFRLMTTHWRAYLGVVLAGLLPLLVPAAALGYLVATSLNTDWLDDVAEDGVLDNTDLALADNVGTLVVAGALLLVIVVVVWQLVWTALFHQGYWQLAGAPPTVGQSVRHALGRATRVIGVSLLLGLIAIGGIVVLLVVGALLGPLGIFVAVVALIPLALLYWVWSQLSYSVAAIGPSMSSIKTGWALSRPAFWGILGRVLLGAVVSFGVSLVAQMTGLAGQTLPAALAVGISVLVTVVAQVVQTLLAVIVVAVIYFDLGGPIADDPGAEQGPVSPVS